MILVDVYVPSVDKTYDFQLSEKSKISIIIEEITEMVERKEHCKIKGNTGELLLCRYKGEEVLNRNATLDGLGISSGEKLILI